MREYGASLRHLNKLFQIKQADTKERIFEYFKTICRSSRSHMFFKIDVLKSFERFTGKHLCWSYLLIKLQAWPATLLKRNSSTGVFL